METPVSRKSGLGRIALAVTVLAIALMWIYAFSGLADRDPSDRLDGRAFPEAAEEVCAATRRQLDTLPHVTESSPPDQLADVVDEANEQLQEMVDRLADLAPSGDGDGRLVGLWLDDWEIHLGDRAAWAADVRAGNVRVFTETDRGGGALSEAMDNFADVNDMPSCETP